MPPFYHSQTSVTIVEPRTTSDSHARQRIFRPRREEPSVTTSNGCPLELASTSISASTTSTSKSMSTSKSTSESTSTCASKFAQAASATSLSHFIEASSESTQRQRSRIVVSDALMDSDFDFDADADSDFDSDSDHDYDCNSEYGSDCDCDSCESTTGTKALNSPFALLDARHWFVLGSCPSSPLSRMTATSASASASATSRPMLSPTTSMKNFRKRTRAVYGVGGAAVGTLLCPVVGTVVGAIGVGCSVNYVLKRRERWAFAKWEKRSVQEQALASVAAVSEHAVYV